MKISTDLWFDVARAKAESVVQDPEDRKLLAPETYDLIHAVDYPHMGASGIFGDYVEVEAFQQLGDRFLLACELIKTMESNSLGMPDSPDPALVPSEEVFPASVDAADLIDDEIEASRRDGDWSRSYTRVLSIVDEALRSQLARKDERMRDLVEEALGTIESTVVAHGWWSSWTDRARAALGEPDGRKGE